MPLTDYTTNAEVRAVLGVSEDELEDETLDLPIYLKALEDDLNGLDDNLLTLYTTALEPTPTKDQKAFAIAVQLYSAYNVAYQCLTGLSYFAPRKIQDGKGVMERVADPFGATRDAVEAMLSKFRARVIETLTALGEDVSLSAVPVWNLAGVVSSGFDNVTGT